MHSYELIYSLKLSNWPRVLTSASACSKTLTGTRSATYTHTQPKSPWVGRRNNSATVTSTYITSIIESQPCLGRGPTHQCGLHGRNLIQPYADQTIWFMQNPVWSNSRIPLKPSLVMGTEPMVILGWLGTYLISTGSTLKKFRHTWVTYIMSTVSTLQTSAISWVGKEEISSDPMLTKPIWSTQNQVWPNYSESPCNHHGADLGPTSFSMGKLEIDPSGNRPTAFFVIFATNSCPF